MNEAVSNFYINQSNDGYEKQHGARLNFVFNRYNLNSVKNEGIADFGGGHGFFIKKFDSSNHRYILDGANINSKELNDLGIDYLRRDLNIISDNDTHFCSPLDKVFCFETLEHLHSPYKCLEYIKSITKIDGEIYISVPDKECHHNTFYPGLLYPESNFVQFLEQMAFRIEDQVFSDHSFKSWIYKCINRPWNEKKLKYSKGTEEKFWNATIEQVVNL